jgi:fructose-bisphosphate aldolase, class II
MYKSAKNILQDAKNNNYAVAALNVSSLEAIRSVLNASAQTSTPIMIELSKGEANHIGIENVFDICESINKIIGADYCLHLDRGNDLELMKKCLDHGFNSISADFAMPYEKNLELSHQARELTNQYDAQLEATIDYVPYVGYKPMEKDDLTITDVAKAQTFIDEIKPDSFIVSIGTQSGKYKIIDQVRYDVWENINNLNPNLPLVLHGGSFLDKEIVINAINKGISKINLNSELRIAYTDTLKNNINENPKEYAPYRLLANVVEVMEAITEEKILLYKNKK